MKKVTNVLIAIMVASYPFIIYFGLQRFSVRYLTLSITIIFCLRLVLLKDKASKNMKLIAMAMSLVGISLCLSSAITNNLLIIKLYPVAINLMLFTVFTFSLFNPPTMIEKLARITTKNLPPEAIHYTRKVTIVWSAFFMVNAFISLFITLFYTMKAWTLYNGFIAYILMGLLFGIEFMIRQIVKRSNKNAHPN